MTGAELKEKRKELGYKQDGLAEQLGIATNTVSRWERDDISIPPYLPLALKSIPKAKKPPIKKSK